MVWFSFLAKILFKYQMEVHQCFDSVQRGRATNLVGILSDLGNDKARTCAGQDLPRSTLIYIGIVITLRSEMSEAKFGNVTQVNENVATAGNFFIYLGEMKRGGKRKKGSKSAQRAQ